MAKKLKVTLIKSRFGGVPKCRKVLVSLGLNKISDVRIHPDNAAIRGMIFHAKHLLKVEEVEA